jgi:hypothetical protein
MLSSTGVVETGVLQSKRLTNDTTRQQTLKPGLWLFRTLVQLHMSVCAVLWCRCGEI